jgi:hypothetical protein
MIDAPLFISAASRTIPAWFASPYFITSSKAADAGSARHGAVGLFDLEIGQRLGQLS